MIKFSIFVLLLILCLACKKEKQDTFFKIKILKNKTQIIYFYNSAFCFSQSFSFGSDIKLEIEPLTNNVSKFIIIFSQFKYPLNN